MTDERLKLPAADATLKENAKEDYCEEWVSLVIGSRSPQGPESVSKRSRRPESSVESLFAGGIFPI